jgi:hypothetical protein
MNVPPRRMPSSHEVVMSNMAIYLIGVVILIAGLAWGASIAGLSSTWIAVGALVLLGAGIVGAVGRTRRPEHSPSDE